MMVNHRRNSSKRGFRGPNPVITGTRFNRCNRKIRDIEMITKQNIEIMKIPLVIVNKISEKKLINIDIHVKDRRLKGQGNI